MSYQEKRTIASMISGLLVMAAYCIYAFVIRPEGGDLKYWGVTMLIFIGVGVAAAIVIQIIYHIALSVAIAVRERDRGEEQIEKSIEGTMVEDEMDKLIDLKSSKTGFAVAGTGLLAALAALAFGASAAVMLNIVFLSFMAGTLCEGFVSLYYYRKGVRNA